MAISIFLSTVSDEFRAYRDRLRGDLTLHNVAVKVQEDFKGLGGDTLDKLDVYIAHCDAVGHLVSEITGSAPGALQVQALLRRYSDLPTVLPPLEQALRDGADISYTQWEAWLALYHSRLLLTAKAEPHAPRGPGRSGAGPGGQEAGGAEHARHLRAGDRRRPPGDQSRRHRHHTARTRTRHRAGGV